MRLTRFWLPISSFKNVPKPYFLPFSSSITSTAFQRQISGVAQNHQCSCVRSSKRFDKNSLMTSVRRYNVAVSFVHSRAFSSNVPPLTVANDSSSPTAGNNEANAKPKSRTLDQVVYHLQSDIRRKRRIHRADIHNAIELVEKASKVEDFGKFLLNCCCDILPDLHPTYRVKLAERIWTVIQKGNEYSSAHFEAMMKVLALNEDKSLDPLRFLEEAKSVGVKATGTMYFFALLLVCQRGDLEAAVNILNTMKDSTIPVNERFFNALMLGNLRSGDLKGVTDIWDIMKASQIEPSVHTWNTLLQIYTEIGDLKRLRETYAEMAASRLTEDQFYDLLKTAGRQNNLQILNLVIGWALESQKIHALSVMNVSLQLMHLGNFQSALNIIFKFESLLRSRKEALGTFFIRELQSVSTLTDPEEYVRLVKSLQGQNKNPYALNLAAESCLKHKKFDFAFRIFESMLSIEVPVRSHYFLPAFIAEMEENGSLGGLKVLKQMYTLGIQPDWDMLLNWVIPMLLHAEGNLLETLKMVKEACGLSYSSGNLLSAGLVVAVQEGKLQEGIEVVGKLKGKLSYPEAIMQSLLLYICDMEKPQELNNVIKFIKFVSDNKPFQDKQDYVGSFIIKLLEADRSEEAEQLLKDIVDLSIPVSNAAAEIMKEKIVLKDELKVDGDLFFQHYNSGAGKHILHVNELDAIGLECHKQELESKGMNARGTTRKLFLKYCTSGDLEKVLECKSSFEKEFGNISRGMKSALMGVYVRQGLLDPALLLFQELTDVTEKVSDVVVDVYKIIDLATLMVKNGKTEEAIILIHEKCPTRRIHRPEAISRNIVRLLEAVSTSSADSDYVGELTQLFLKLRFINPTNASLGPSIRDLIRKNNLEGAVEQFERYTQQFSVNPCLQELTYVVLEKPELLERVTKCSTLVKGDIMAKCLLALARADVGDIDGAAKGFMELGSDLRFPSLQSQCEYLSSRNEIQKILNLISALQKTGQNYDCRSLYDIGIQACKRSGNKEGLKLLISSMEEQDLYISQSLKEQLVKSR